MQKLKARIGTKLGASALVGLLLVAGMVGNPAPVNGVTQKIVAEAAESQQLQKAALEAKTAVHELISIDREIRWVKTPSDIKHVLQQLANQATVGTNIFDGAIRSATVADDRKLLLEAKEAFN